MNDNDINDACMSNPNVKSRSLSRRKKRTEGHIHVTHDTQIKMIVILTGK